MRRLVNLPATIVNAAADAAKKEYDLFEKFGSEEDKYIYYLCASKGEEVALFTIAKDGGESDIENIYWEDLNAWFQSSYDSLSEAEMADWEEVAQRLEEIESKINGL